MEKKFIDLWEKNKNKLEDYFRNTEQREYDTYSSIVKKIIELVINDEDNVGFRNYEADRMTVVDDGSYQGTEIFIIPRNTYQPDAGDYIFTHNYYGSCSGCDTLQAIHWYRTDKKPTEEQVKDYMTLALHLVQNLKYLIPREENNE